MQNIIALLRDNRIPPTPQRLAVVEIIVKVKSHHTADQIWEEAKIKCPTISRATVYNTLNLLVQKGLLEIRILKEGTTVFDANTSQHHHFIDEESGTIYDIPWDALKITGQDSLKDFQVRDIEVILYGIRKKK